MNEKNLLDGLQGQETQSVDAVKALIAFYNHGEEPAEMPASYQRMVRMAREEAESEHVDSLITRGGFKPCIPEEA